MGEYQLPGVEAVVKVDEGRFAGAEITVNLDVGVDVYLEVERLTARQDPASESAEEKMARWDRLLVLLDESILLRWNLRSPKGRPIATDLAGIRTVPPDLIGEILVGWASAMRGEGSPFSQPSRPGEPAAAQDPSLTDSDSPSSIASSSTGA